MIDSGYWEMKSPDSYFCERLAYPFEPFSVVTCFIGTFMVSHTWWFSTRKSFLFTPVLLCVFANTLASAVFHLFEQEGPGTVDTTTMLVAAYSSSVGVTIALFPAQICMMAFLCITCVGFVALSLLAYRVPDPFFYGSYGLPLGYNLLLICVALHQSPLSYKNLRWCLWGSACFVASGVVFLITEPYCHTHLWITYLPTHALFSHVAQYLGVCLFAMGLYMYQAAPHSICELKWRFGFIAVDETRIPLHSVVLVDSPV